MKQTTLALSLSFFAALTAAPHASAQTTPAISEAEARSISTDAYLYFYPLVTMDLTRKQMINSDPKIAGIGGPPNTFDNVQAFPTADMRVVVRPNFDTLYSSAWVDLTREPMVISAPDTGGRYYLLPMLDMWTDVFVLSGLAHDGHQGGQFPARASRLEWQSARGLHAHQCADALCLDHRPHEDGWATRLRCRS
jgi:hypothetical protein